MTKLKLIKTILYIILGILIIVFRKPLYDYVGYLIALSVLLFGIDSYIEAIEEKFSKKAIPKIIDGSLLIVASVVVCILVKELIVVCFVWGFWAILREIKEMNHDLYHIIQKKYGFLSMIESIGVVIVSIVLLTNPTEHHVKFHIVLLGVEFILEVLFPILYMYIEKRRAKKKELTA